MELPLRFHREILRQLIPGTPDTATPDPSDTSTQDLDPCESGLLILARGLGLRRVVCSFLTLQSDPRRLVLLLNADSPEEDGIGDLLGTMGVAKPGLRVVNFDMISKQREELYKEGGLVSVTSRILVVDMLNGTIPVHLISGMVILHAEQVTPTSLETFITRIYRKYNKEGFLKAFSDNPELFASGVSPLQTVLRSLGLRKVWIWPRFHETIQEDLDKRKADVVELYPSLTKSMLNLQHSILQCMDATIQEIKKGNVANLDIDDFTVDNALFRSFDKIIKMQLLPVWHLIKPKTKRLIEDLSTLRNLLSFLLNYSCVEFEELLESIYQSNLNEYKSSSTGNKTPSHWLYLDPADAIFSVAKERTYKVVENGRGGGASWLPPNIVPVLEEQPKWGVLTEILAEIDNNIQFNKGLTQSENNMTLIMCGTNRTVIQLTEYLSQCEDDNSKTHSTHLKKKAPKMMKRLLRDHLEKFKANVGIMSTNMKFNAQSNVANTNAGSPSKNSSSSDKNAVEQGNSQATSAALQRKEQFRRNEGATAYGHNRRRVRGGSVMASVASSRKTHNNLDANAESPLEAEAKQIAQFQSQRSGKDKEVIELSDEDDDEDYDFFDNLPQWLLTTDVNEIWPHDDNDEYGLMEEEDTLLIRAYRGDDDDALLDEIKPKFIVMYDPDPAFVRRVEVYKSSNPHIDIRLYFLLYNASVEEQRYLSGLRKEKDAFERLIREKSTMLLPLFEKESTRAGTDHYLSALSARVAGGQQVVGDKQPIVVVDVREFRSSLPGILHSANFDVQPTTLTVGDYVLDPTMVVERKSLTDLNQSFQSGRLFTQCEYMSTYYKTPILLIEFEENRSFSLETIAESKKNLHPAAAQKTRITGTSPTEIFQSRLVMLTISFPRLRIIWSSSPRQTAEIFSDLKVQREEPDVEKASGVGTDEAGLEDLIEENWTMTPVEVMKSMPGVSGKNYQYIPNKISLVLLLSITQPTQYTPRILRLNNKDHKSSYHRPPLSNTNGLDPKDLQKAAFVVLARNSDLYSFLPSMRAVEDRFNSKFGYEWVFLNDKPFNDEFKAHTQALASSHCHYGTIPSDHWNQPSFINETLAAENRHNMEKLGVVPYANSVPYRNMCRFNSGFFWRHPLLNNFDYYWRVEPDISLYCDVDYDPFKFVAENDINYGFTVSLLEYEETIPSLWQTVKDFIRDHPEHIPKDNAMKFLSDDSGESYNRCHFWSNFEIANLNLWRSPAYKAFFDYLDQAGGFYYERWGDAPVHSIAAALFSRPDQIHFFEDFGYRHQPFQHCPQGDASLGRCYCDPSDNIDYQWYSCLSKYDALTATAKYALTGDIRNKSTRHSVYGTESKIVIDPGSRVIKVGFSGEASPRESITVEVEGGLWDLNGVQNELGLLDAFREIYYTHLQVDPKQRRVIILENDLLSTPVRRAIMGALFTSMQVTAVSFTPATLAALMAAGRTTGLVVDVGYLQTVVSAVYAARPMLPLTVSSPLAGKRLTNHLRNLVLAHGVYYPALSTNQLSNAAGQPPPGNVPHEAVTDAWIEDVKCRALLAESGTENESGIDSETDKPSNANDNDNKNANQIAVKIQTSHGRGVVFIPGWVRARAVEELLESRGDIDEPSIPECVVKCMQALPIDLRRELSASCLVVGGTASIVGFRRRLGDETRALLQRTTRTATHLNDLSSLSTSFEVINDPMPRGSQPTGKAGKGGKGGKANKAPAWNPACYAWVGGSLAGAVRVSAAEIHKEDFESLEREIH
ncbi:hypothetical protein E3P89_02156 [Wallemia ichthyophaga]|uniref:ERCC4 domain-containing protein n=1 Tax=Wallemia ichthyophaga TaxID=245174 RepID=A0A4T0I2P9_WALIC|nr:hypothetical protein E3P97_02276 [Wallemia ichthyophaga]TIB11700.1 hypothetical protein E3P90_02291 [Wallemia ichthyophaga]TIB13101.1 hypothetical protein E3P93_02051 [Wallemia ichthyophaga]TIB22227.1 hypothetical protein E3P89_02156 [Wallemia ichthyophaga]TIB23966.1 hypothetical protein E3P88_02247 [Wallemia ichthyophaga]